MFKQKQYICACRLFGVVVYLLLDDSNSKTCFGMPAIFLIRCRMTNIVPFEDSAICKEICNICYVYSDQAFSFFLNQIVLPSPTVNHRIYKAIFVKFVIWFPWRHG